MLQDDVWLQLLCEERTLSLHVSHYHSAIAIIPILNIYTCIDSLPAPLLPFLYHYQSYYTLSLFFLSSTTHNFSISHLISTHYHKNLSFIITLSPLSQPDVVHFQQHIRLTRYHFGSISGHLILLRTRSQLDSNSKR